MTTSTLAPLELSPRAGAGVRPLEGFGTTFGWGLRAVLFGKRFVVVACAAGALGLLLGSEGFGGQRRYDPAFSLWQTIDEALLTFVVPLVALGLVSFGFAREVQDRTLVYHLVRPVSRRTVFLARYFSGLVAGVLATLVLVGALIGTSGVALPVGAWVETALSACLGVAAIGAVYYTLAAVWRFGTIAGLVYTFLIETALSTTRGFIQSLAVSFHVRSLHHRLTDETLSSLMRPTNVAAVERKAQTGGSLIPAADRIAWDEPGQAVLILVAIAACALLVGAIVISRRDYALKD